MKILQINTSVQYETSVSRHLAQILTDEIGKNQDIEIVEMDLAKGVPLLNRDVLDAFASATPEMAQETLDILNLSNKYVEEVKSAELLIIATPIYNFGVPASLKAYFDLLARAGITFKYSKSGPIGLIENKKAYIIVASGGTKFKSKDDFASGYIEKYLNFIGITDVHFIVADQLAFDKKNQIAGAEKQIKELVH